MSKEQAAEVDGVRFEVTENAGALKSLAEGIDAAIMKLSELGRHPATRKNSPYLCDEIEVTAEVVNGYCSLIKHVAANLDETAKKAEEIWSKLAA